MVRETSIKRIFNAERYSLRHLLSCTLIYKQKAFAPFRGSIDFLPITEQLCKEVILLAIHTEMTPAIQDEIIQAVLFLNQNNESGSYLFCP